MRFNVVFVIVLTLGVFGCASKTEHLKPVSPSVERVTELETFSCHQLSLKMLSLQKKIKQLAQVQNENAESDETLIAWGWMMYGVPYFWLNGNGETKEQFEAALGEKEALEALVTEKGCQFD